MRSRVWFFFYFATVKLLLTMPKRLRSGKTKKQTGPAKRRPRRRRTGPSMQARIKRVENMINKTIENKYVDYQATTVNGDQIYAASPVTELAFFRMNGTGPDDNERIGDKVTLLSQRWMMNLKKGATPNLDQRVRLLIVQNIGYDSATDLDVPDVLEYGDWATHNQTILTSPYKIGADATKRYRVLFDKVYSLTNDRPYVKIDVTKKYGTRTNPGKVCSYELPLSDFPNNHRICVFALSDYVTGSFPPTLTILCRNRYKDA